MPARITSLTASLFIAATSIVASNGNAFADCKVWAVEDTSTAQQHRARVFASSDLTERAQLVTEASGIARRMSRDYDLDFIDIFLTRPVDGEVRADHNALTTTVWLRYNPGKTPVTETLMEADAVGAGANVETMQGILMGERVKLSTEQIDHIVDKTPAGVSASCSGEQ